MNIPETKNTTPPIVSADIVSIAEAASEIQKSVATVQRWISLGQLRVCSAVGEGAQRLHVTRESLDALKASGKLRSKIKSPIQGPPMPVAIVPVQGVGVQEEKIAVAEIAAESAVAPSPERTRRRKGRKISLLRRAKRFLRNYPKTDLVKLAQWLPERLARREQASENRDRSIDQVDLHGPGSVPGQ